MERPGTAENATAPLVDTVSPKARRMSDATSTAYDLAAFDIGPLRRRRSIRSVAEPAALVLGVVVASGMLFAVVTAVPPASGSLGGGLQRPGVQAYGPLLHPAYPLGAAPTTLAESGPLPARFVAAPQTVAERDDATAPRVAEPDAPVPQPVPAPDRTQAVAEAEPLPVTLPVQPPAVPDLADGVPLPLPRPPAFRAPASRPPFRTASRSFTARRQPGPPLAAPDTRNFFEKLFGAAQPMQPAAGPALAYAAPETTAVAPTRSLFSAAPAPYDRQTAIYDIAAHTVYMPSGARLEAHSGLGASLDDPRRVHERNRGATPPHLYDLTPREQLFHGVRALRLTPVGDGSVFGRNGLLAHSYMLGPNGDSNGCVSFRDYAAFLQAYASGEVRRLAVVARRG